MFVVTAESSEPSTLLIVADTRWRTEFIFFLTRLCSNSSTILSDVATGG